MGGRVCGDGCLRRVLQVIVEAYDGDTYRLLGDLAGLLGASVAYVDRPTIEAHLERTLTEREWVAVAAELAPMAFDEHVGEAGSVRTEWIDDVLARAGVPAGSRAAARHPVTAPHERRS